MANAKTPASRTRKSKAETQAEFEKLETQVASKKSDYDAKSEETMKIKEAEIKEAVADLSVESIVQKIGGLGVDINKSLADLSSRLMTGTHLLNSLREAVALERREIERLHQIDVAKTSVDSIVEDYRQTKLALEKEIEANRSRWAAEQEQKEREKREFDESLKKQRAREREEYEYQKLLERKKDEDQYQSTQRSQERQNLEKQEALEKLWAEREITLKQREEELARLKSETSGFPETLRAAVEKNVEAAVKAEKLKHQQELLLLQKEFESEKKIAELKTKSFEETVNRQYAQIESLSNRLEEAKNQVQEIAVKAIEGASGARALSHVNQIAMEQAKPRGTSNV